jgi:hypothetical protein
MAMRIFFGLLILVWVSCGGKKEDSVEIPELTFKLDSLSEKTCVGESCATIRLAWPVAEGGEQALKINRSILEKLEALVQTGEEVLPLDSAKSNYFRSFESFKSEFPDSHGGWEIEVEGDVSYISDSTLSIRFNWMSFLGGAHPNHGKSFMNFEPKTGDYLSTDRLILDEERLREQVEKKFREFHQVAEGVSLADDGRFFLPETGFFLANAMGFQDGKFWVVYIPYEIGPYSMGYTELEFSPEELKGIVRW